MQGEQCVGAGSCGGEQHIARERLGPDRHADGRQRSRLVLHAGSGRRGAGGVRARRRAFRSSSGSCGTARTSRREHVRDRVFKSKNGTPDPVPRLDPGRRRQGRIVIERRQPQPHHAVERRRSRFRARRPRARGGGVRAHQVAGVPRGRAQRQHHLTAQARRPTRRRHAEHRHPADPWI